MECSVEIVLRDQNLISHLPSHSEVIAFFLSQVTCHKDCGGPQVVLTVKCRDATTPKEGPDTPIERITSFSLTRNIPITIISTVLVLQYFDSVCYFIYSRI